MELVCFICQEYQSEIGHQTSSCPKVACKKCGQNGHFGMNCEIRGTADEKNEIEAIERFDNGVTGQSFSESVIFSTLFNLIFSCVHILIKNLDGSELYLPGRCKNVKVN
jgi:hypothetical protein